jgi:hypothetical protein
MGLTLALLSVGCVSHKASGGNPAGIEVTATNTARVLHGRRLAISLGAPHHNADVWLLTHGRLVDVSKKVRVATGWDTCYGSEYGGGPGPCYRIANPFSLSRDGNHLALVLRDTSGAPDATPAALIVSRADGMHARRVAAGIDICALCQVSTPSWDRNGRSFVIGVEEFGNFFGSLEKIYRIAVRSGEATLL